jgi:hypothetical protein
LRLRSTPRLRSTCGLPPGAKTTLACTATRPCARSSISASGRFFAWTPYLYRELGGDLEQEERALIETGAIQATGFYYVGERLER